MKRTPKSPTKPLTDAIAVRVLTTPFLITASAPLDPCRSLVFAAPYSADINFFQARWYSLPDPSDRMLMSSPAQVVLYEDELADSGVALLTVKVRVMPSGWFLLLRYWLRVDGVLMRLRDTRVYCAFSSDDNAMPTIIREICWREATIQSLSAVSH